MDKNKVGIYGRECDFEILFGYGIDDMKACLTWLDEANSLEDVGISKKEIKAFCQKMMKAPDDEFRSELARIQEATKQRWREVDSHFVTPRRKYA